MQRSFITMMRENFPLAVIYVQIKKLREDVEILSAKVTALSTALVSSPSNPGDPNAAKDKEPDRKAHTR